MEEYVLSVQDLKTKFFTRHGVVNALDGVNLTIRKGEIMGVVGETGCGKSVLALSIMGLVKYPGKVVEGSVVFRGRDLTKLDPDEMRKIRGSGIAMVFQDPLTFLNPVFTIGDQLSEVFLFHAEMDRKVVEYRIAKAKESLAESTNDGQRDQLIEEINTLERAKEAPAKASSKEARKAAWYFSTEMMRLLEISDPERVAKFYPHELSGGMRQRIMIAMALALEPDLLIADEATTALDVTTQAQILQLLKELRSRINSAILIITHDLGIVAQTCERVAVMYAGKIVEFTQTRELFSNPKHPYTQGLLSSVPRMSGPEADLEWIPGSVPDMINLPSGCTFHPRCPFAQKLCEQEAPEMLGETSHLVRCHLYGKLQAGRQAYEK
ncbi:MAG: ABC transporter ATP-binding protein [Thaumarchaeota archaeon]|nr:ABC transporter ATP-binding protein [Nitrososphaerota archaeon]